MDTTTTSAFFLDVWNGLNDEPKHLSSKYFYDAEGDRLFTEIMACPEYYLTRCELDIFTNQKEKIADSITAAFREFDIVELGAGDCTKSIYLLQELIGRHADFTYYPIDISANVIGLLDKKLPAALPGIKLHGLNGDYFDMLEQAKQLSSRNKVVLFLGSNIGNIPASDTVSFLKKLKSCLLPGDLLLTGFDLIKDPALILAAYNDKQGFTRDFNLNLLKRINILLDAGFDLAQFEHRPVYNPETGACKSYLQSKIAQIIHIGKEGTIEFAAGEQIFMEISQKYTVQQTDYMATASGFIPVHHFFDGKGWFLDALWRCR